MFGFMMKKVMNVGQAADMLAVSKETLRRWDNSGKLIARRHPISGYRVYEENELKQLNLPNLEDTDEQLDHQLSRPIRTYKSVELFAGAGGLALGFEAAGFECQLLSEIDKNACATLRKNRPDWNVAEGDVGNINFTSFRGKVDVITGGFPCQAFSYAGKKLGFSDARGTLFYEFARAIKEVQPIIAIGENVRGLISHDGGKTIQGMSTILEEIGYRVISPKVLKAIHFKVPQKRERLFLIAIRKDVLVDFNYPKPKNTIYTLSDALKRGRLFSIDAPISAGQDYPVKKKEIMKLVPPGGYWRDLPVDIQKEYMKKSYYLTGGRTGIARKISWDEPSLTLTCAPAQKQTERCHPDFNRPFTVREYARIQTFPDIWEFSGSLTSQYKQIGNAVPINLAFSVAQSVVDFLNRHNEKLTPSNEGNKKRK
jgi:DNA (cytosine-5)-methyltransferase 1